MQDFRIKVNEVNLQVRQYAHPGEAILFLHFGGGNLMMWQGALPYFEGRYQLLMPDLRGHGQSDSPPDGYHIDQMAADVLGLMAHLGIERAHLVGSSLGAETALSLAANHPDKVLSLVCEGAFHSEYGPYSSDDFTAQAFQAHVNERMAKMRAEPEPIYDSVEAFMAETQQTFEAYDLWNERVAAMKRYNLHQIADGKYVYQWRKSTRLAYMQDYFGYRFEDYYRRVVCPAMMMPGEDQMGDEGIQRAMQALCQLAPNCRLAAPPGWEHPYGWLMTPQVGSQAVLAFLEEVQDEMA